LHIEYKAIAFNRTFSAIGFVLQWLYFFAAAFFAAAFRSAVEFDSME